MEILQVIPYFVPAWDYGGPVSSVYNLSKELVKRGHSITVYTTDALNSSERTTKNEEIIDGIRVKRFRNLSNSIASKYKIFFSQSMLFHLKSSLKEFDIVHAHEYRTLQNIIVHHYAKKYNVPLVLQPRGSLPRIMNQRGLKMLYDVLWGYKILKDTSRVVAISEIEVKQCMNAGVDENKIEIVSNGIDLSEFNNLPNRGEFRGKYGLNAGQKIILYLGRLNKIKGLDLLLKTFSDLLKSMGNVKLVIVGPDDGYLPHIKKLIVDLNISNEILLTGPLYGEEKLGAYVDADVYVLPSLYEIFGITVLEALACGIPVIITDGCGLANYIDGKAGIVIPYDREKFRGAILHMLGNEKLRLRFCENGKLLVRDKFSWSKIAERIEKIYQRCKNQ